MFCRKGHNTHSVKYSLIYFKGLKPQIFYFFLAANLDKSLNAIGLVCFLKRILKSAFLAFTKKLVLDEPWSEFEDWYLFKTTPPSLPCPTSPHPPLPTPLLNNLNVNLWQPHDLLLFVWRLLTNSQTLEIKICQHFHCKSHFSAVTSSGTEKQSKPNHTIYGTPHWLAKKMEMLLSSFRCLFGIRKNLFSVLSELDALVMEKIL